MLARHGHPIQHARVGILGFTFKEDVPDIRNSKIWDVYCELRSFGIEPIVHDPKVDAKTMRQTYGIELAPIERFRDLAALIYAIPHKEYLPLEAAMGESIAPGGILVDIRARLSRSALRSDIHHSSL